MTAYNKLWVALAMVVAQWLQTNYGIELPLLEEESASVLISTLTALLVYLVPNK